MFTRDQKYKPENVLIYHQELQQLKWGVFTTATLGVIFRAKKCQKIVRTKLGLVAFKALGVSTSL